MATWKDPQHFRALSRTAWVNEFNELSMIATKHRKEVFESDSEDESCCVDVGDLNNDGELSIMIEQAPSDIKLVLQLMLTATVEVLEMFSSVWKQRDKKKEFGNTHLCEILGLPPKTDIVGKINHYFGV